MIVDAQPALAILRAAHERGVGLIALTTHGPGGLRRLVLGSVTDKIVRGADGPVLVYRPPDAPSPERDAAQ